MTTYWRVIKNI